MKNINAMALRGADIKDAEYIEMFNLDPSLEGKPELNEKVLQKVWDENYKNFLRMGKDESEAKKLSDKNRKIAASDINMLYKKNNIKAVIK